MTMSSCRVHEFHRKVDLKSTLGEVLNALAYIHNEKPNNTTRLCLETSRKCISNETILLHYVTKSLFKKCGFLVNISFVSVCRCSICIHLM